MFYMIYLKNIPLFTQKKNLSQCYYLKNQILNVFLSENAIIIVIEV